MFVLTLFVCGAMFVLSALLFRGCLYVLNFVFSTLTKSLCDNHQSFSKRFLPRPQIVAKWGFFHLLVALPQLVKHIQLLPAIDCNKNSSAVYLNW